ncbi:MAG: hypothetical protein ACQEQS_09045 [Thermodesulfobacteriota bacterium]
MNNLLSGDNGSALLLTVIILVLITIIGLASIGSSVFNLEIAGHIKDSESLFYRGEALPYKACSDIQEKDNVLLRDYDVEWIHSRESFEDLPYSVDNPVFIKDSQISDLFEKVEAGVDSDFDNISYKSKTGSEIYNDWLVSEDSEIICFYNGTKGSQDITGGHTLHEYIIFSKYTKDKSGTKVQKIFELGFRKQY